jgi:transcriptional regulator with XRE-family HTH domain
MIDSMDPVRLGADLRLLRIRKGWSQSRLARESRVPRWVVVDVEGGRAGRCRIEHLAELAAAAGGYLSVRVQFHGEGLDRLRDRDHAALVDQLVEWLRAVGWDVATEVSFNEYGERGSIDILAFHPETGALLVVEVKTVVPDVGGMLATLDRKVRLARGIAATRGWQVRTVARLLVLPDGSTARRRVEQHAATFTNAFPERTAAVRRWLRSPVGVLSGLIFLSNAQPADNRRRSGPSAKAPPATSRSDGD